MTLRSITILLIASLCACGSGAATHPEGAPRELPADLAAALPRIAQLDGLPGAASSASTFRGYGAAEFARRASALASSSLPLDPPFLSAHTVFNSPSLLFNHHPTEIAYALYRISPPGGTVQDDWLSIRASGSGGVAGLWLIAADYATGRWEQAAPISSGAASIALSGIGNPQSPGGFIYCALVVPTNATDGIGASLSGLFFDYDDGLPSGPTYYVATPADGGDDGNDGSQQHPWATLQFAADTVVAGDTVIVLPGDYAGFMLQHSGAPGSPITFSAQAGVTIVSDNENTPDGINIENWDGPPGIHDVVVEGFSVDGATRTGIRIAGFDADDLPGTDAGYAHDITVRNNTLTNNQVWGILSGHVDRLTVEGNICSFSGEQHGIYLSNSADGDIARWNVCHDNNDSGIQYNADQEQSGDATMSDGSIEYNICYNNGTGGGSALNLDGVATTLIRGNLLYNNHAGGLVIYNGDGLNSQDNIVLNNTILMPSDGRWCINMGTSPGNLLRNNILLSDHGFRGAITLDSASLTGLDSDYNIMISRISIDDGNPISLAEWQSGYSQDAHSAVNTAAELFVSPGAADYHLKSGSPAINFGVNAADLPGLDLDKLTRPQGSSIDAGAYEFEE